MEHVHPVAFLRYIPLFPLIGAVLNGLAGWAIQRKLGKTPVHVAAVGLPALSFCFAVYGLYVLAGLPAEQRMLLDHAWTWIAVGPVRVNFAFAMDPLGAVMALTVSGVGSVIHLYSVGYMAHEKSYWRYFSYLNLFMFAMLVLVLADNMLLMFIGWEGVGLCSYLLIGFWYEDIEKAKAGMKAFVVNRVGDFGFLCGMLLLFWGLGGSWSGGHYHSVSTDALTLTFREIQSYVHLLADKEFLGVALPTMIGIFLFVGAIGKSAQIPLYVWLPDAMAGPTPVSALIHAATMVTAGVYMVARMNFLYCMSPVAMTVVATVGAVTALYAGTIGFFQFDIKKVLAYSTVSQLGYMFLGVGVGAYAAGIFHLFTHAFFKACLFLGAGSIIHALSGEQDMRKMGGLKDVMPATHVTFAISTLAIAGIPLFAGFFSKDEILWSAFNNANTLIPGWILWAIGFIGAGCTAFYMYRLYYMTFSGELRASEEVKHHAHESPKVMTIPLWILACGAVVTGFLGLPALFFPNLFEEFLKPVFHHAEQTLRWNFSGAEGHGSSAGTAAALILMCASVAAAVAGILLARKLYKDAKSDKPRQLAEEWPVVYRTVQNKYYVDEIYGKSFVAGTLGVSRISAKFDNVVIDGLVNFSGTLTRFVSWVDGAIDKYGVDGAVNLTAWIVTALGRRMRKIQTGDLHQYLYGALGGAILLVVIGYVLFS